MGKRRICAFLFLISFLGIYGWNSFHFCLSSTQCNETYLMALFLIILYPLMHCHCMFAHQTLLLTLRLQMEAYVCQWSRKATQKQGRGPSSLKCTHTTSLNLDLACNATQGINELGALSRESRQPRHHSGGGEVRGEGLVRHSLHGLNAVARVRRD